MLTILVGYFAVGYLVMDFMFAVSTALKLREKSGPVRLIFMVLFLMVKYALIWPAMTVDSMLHVSIDAGGEEERSSFSPKPMFNGLYDRMKETVFKIKEFAMLPAILGAERETLELDTDADQELDFDVSAEELVV